MNARLTESAPIHTNLKPVPQPEVITKRPEPEPEVVKEPKSNTDELTVVIEPGVESLPEYAPVPEVISKPEVEPEVKPEIKPEVKLEVKPDVKPEVKTEIKPEVKLGPVIDFTKLEVPKSYIKPDISEQENFIVAFGGWNFTVPKDVPPKVTPEVKSKVKSEPKSEVKSTLSTPKPSGPIKSPQVQSGIFKPNWKIFSLNSPGTIDILTDKNKK